MPTWLRISKSFTSRFVPDKPILNPFPLLHPSVNANSRLGIPRTFVDETEPQTQLWSIPKNLPKKLSTTAANDGLSFPERLRSNAILFVEFEGRESVT